MPQPKINNRNGLVFGWFALVVLVVCAGLMVASTAGKLQGSNLSNGLAGLLHNGTSGSNTKSLQATQDHLESVIAELGFASTDIVARAKVAACFDLELFHGFRTELVHRCETSETILVASTQPIHSFNTHLQQSLSKVKTVGSITEPNSSYYPECYNLVGTLTTRQKPDIDYAFVSWNPHVYRRKQQTINTKDPAQYALQQSCDKPVDQKYQQVSSMNYKYKQESTFDELRAIQQVDTSKNSLLLMRLTSDY